MEKERERAPTPPQTPSPVSPCAEGKDFSSLPVQIMASQITPETPQTTQTSERRNTGQGLPMDKAVTGAEGDLEVTKMLLKENPQVNISNMHKISFLPVSKPAPLLSFSQKLKTPMLLRVNSSFYSPLGNLILDQGQIIVVMDIYSTRVITGIFANEPFKIIPDFERETKFSPAENGTQGIYTQNELIRANPLPIIVSSLSAFQDKLGKNVTKGSKLLIKKSTKIMTRLTKKSSIHLYDLENTEVFIPKAAAVEFSTRHEDVCLPLSDFTKHFPLPAKAKPISLDDDVNVIPEVELRRLETEEIIVGILPFEKTQMPIVHIPSSVGVQIEVIKPENESKLEEIYIAARYGYVQTTTLMNKALSTQNPRYDRPRKHSEPVLCPRGSRSYSSVRLTKGHRIPKYQNIPFQTQTPTSTSQLEENYNSPSRHDYERLDSPQIVAVRRRYQSESSDSEGLPTAVTSEYYKGRYSPPTTLQDGDGAVQRKGQDQSNLAHLKSFTIIQIQELLKCMNLERYCESFKKEMINGEIFSSLTDEMLQELGVSKQLHRLRIKKVISGDTSVKNLLKDKE